MREKELLKEAKVESIITYGEVNQDFIEGVKFAIAKTRNGRNKKPVRRIGKLSRDYESISEAARDMGCTHVTIYLALKEKRVALNYRWIYL